MDFFERLQVIVNVLEHMARNHQIERLVGELHLKHVDMLHIGGIRVEVAGNVSRRCRIDNARRKSPLRCEMQH